MHFLWVDRSVCPCFIDLTSHKFTTSAFLVHRLTGERFSGGMRSDGGREAVRERGEEQGGWDVRSGMRGRVRQRDQGKHKEGEINWGCEQKG